MVLKLSKAGGCSVTRRVRGAIDHADAARDAGQWDHAASLYRRALELDPSLTAIWVQYGHVLREGGSLKDALEAYGAAVYRSPSDTDARFFLARTYQALGENALALTQFTRALDLGLAGPGRIDALARCDVLHLLSRRDRSERHPNLPAGMTIEGMQERLDALIWHHSIDFGQGLISKSRAPTDFVEATAEALFDGLDLRDRTVIDIGAWSGAYSLEAKRKGARRVLATDKIAWTHPEFHGRETFDLSVQLSGLDIEAREIDLPELTPESVGSFDVALFAGVFYHLQDPIHLTKQISACAEHLLILETHQDALDCPRPSMIFYPGAALNSDSTNWWGPNPQCVYELLSAFGFAEIHYRDAPMMAFRKRGIYHAYRSVESMAELGVTQAPLGWVSLSDPSAREALFAPLPLATLDD